MFRILVRVSPLTLAAGLSILLPACATSGGASAPAPTVQAATQPASIPLQPIALPPHGPLLPGIHTGAGGSVNVNWQYANAPHDGVDAFAVTMTPMVLENVPSNLTYWAYEGEFLDKQAWYMGIQLAGKTALFSVFGAGAVPLTAACKAGADNGPGAGCHLPYEFTLGHSYQFMVRLKSGDSATWVWEGVVADLSTGAMSVIGDISVPASRGLLHALGVSFAEFYKRPTPCTEEPRSEILVHQPIAYRSGRGFAGHIYQLNNNSGCAPQFYGDGQSYVYIDNGGNPLVPR